MFFSEQPDGCFVSDHISGHAIFGPHTRTKTFERTVSIYIVEAAIVLRHFLLDSHEANRMTQSLSFQGDCLFDIDSESSQKSKNIREEQIFAHPFHEDSVLTISFPYGKPTKNLPFFHHLSKHTRMEGSITISSATINAEGFSDYQQQEDNT